MLFSTDVAPNQGKHQKETSLQQHMDSVHKYICSQCTAVFTSAEDLSIHEKRLHGEKTLKCDYCDMMFSLDCHKNLHMNNVHIKKKDKICPHCGEAFFKRSAFDVHVARHTDDRQCVCNECG